MQKGLYRFGVVDLLRVLRYPTPHHGTVGEDGGIEQLYTQTTYIIHMVRGSDRTSTWTTNPVSYYRHRDIRVRIHTDETHRHTGKSRSGTVSPPSP